LQDLADEFAAKDAYRLELSELLDEGELTEQQAEYILAHCQDLISRCLSIRGTLDRVLFIDDNRRNRLDVNCYAKYPRLLTRASRINELLELCEMCFEMTKLPSLSLDDRFELLDRHLDLAQELKAQHETLKMEVNLINFDLDDSDDLLIDDDSDDDDPMGSDDDE
jgi:hypothetical protein